VSFQVVNTFKRSNDPDYEAKKNRILHLYNLADGKVDKQRGDPDVVICFDEFGPLNLPPHPGKQWAIKGGGADQPRRTRRATFTRPDGVRHLLAGYDLSTDRLHGHNKLKKRRTQFLEFCRYLRTLHPPHVRIAIVLDNFSPHLSTKKDQRFGEWAATNNVELVYTAVLRVMAEPDRSPVPGAALLRSRRHRPLNLPRPRRASPHDPPLHPLAQHPRPRPSTHRTRQPRKRCLTRH
jgi:hypothetical protein